MPHKPFAIEPDAYPFLLRHVEKLPPTLDVIGTLPPEDHIYVCVVGSRAYTSYGRKACEHLIAGLQGLPVVIVSGLAIGIDSIAHEAALAAGLRTIAFPGSGLAPDVLYPASRRGLARRIVEAGGALISPFSLTQPATQWTFPTRNQLMAGSAHATVVIEAARPSGTLITARAAANLGRDVLAVPGSIFSALSAGPHYLIGEGARPVTSADELIAALELAEPPAGNKKDSLASVDEAGSYSSAFSPAEQKIMSYLTHPATIDQIIEDLDLSPAEAAAALSALEIRGAAIQEGGTARLAG